ncbi:ABC transporter ATP-binding protein [Olsenella massiliensis]|uniref:ABC transporter ATP-binding protein n=1 Tax=Olsenella massiliensis TaxID=1622075 RepID=UPI00071E601D|nr:ABC transporter ATP-binding protein [Olsenella massiliensis]
MARLFCTRGLTKRYGDFVLDQVDLSLEEGMVLGLVGRNGSGKTTLIRLLLGVVLPDAGTAEVLGVRADARSTAFAAARDKVGFVPDSCPFAGETRVEDVARIGRAVYQDWDGREFDRLCHDLGLGLDKQVKGLSRGMGMKLSLAFALAHRPRLLLLDEATAGLDPIARGEALDLIRDFMTTEGGGVLLSSHITSDLERVADRVACLDEGHILFDLDRDAICDDAGIVRCRSDELGDIMDLGIRVRHNEYSVDVLVPNRRSVARERPGLHIDRASLDEYLALVLTGVPRGDDAVSQDAATRSRREGPRQGSLHREDMR